MINATSDIAECEQTRPNVAVSAADNTRIQAEVVARLDTAAALKRAEINLSLGLKRSLKVDLALIDKQRVVAHAQLLRLAEAERAAAICELDRERRRLAGAKRKLAGRIETMKAARPLDLAARALEFASAGIWRPIPEAAAELGVSEYWLRSWTQGVPGPALAFKLIGGAVHVHVGLSYEHIKRFARRLPLTLKKPIVAQSAAAVNNAGAAVSEQIRMDDFSDDAVV